MQRFDEDDLDEAREDVAFRCHFCGGAEALAKLSDDGGRP